MRLQSLRDLYQHELRDLQDAEDQIIQTLPHMADAATDEELKQQFTTHVQRSRQHRDRLAKILDGIGSESDDVRCEGMRGILREAKRLMEPGDIDDAVRDAALLSVAQRAEHYEMAAYGALRTFARMLGEDEAHRALQATLEEEGAADDRLTRIAEKSVNPSARA